MRDTDLWFVLRMSNRKPIGFCQIPLWSYLTIYLWFKNHSDNVNMYYYLCSSSPCLDVLTAVTRIFPHSPSPVPTLPRDVTCPHTPVLPACQRDLSVRAPGQGRIVSSGRQESAPHWADGGHTGTTRDITWQEMSPRHNTKHNTLKSPHHKTTK